MAPTFSFSRILSLFRGWNSRKETVDKDIEERAAQNSSPPEPIEKEQLPLTPESARTIRKVISSLVRRLSGRKDAANDVAEHDSSQPPLSSPEFRAPSKTIVQTASLLLDLLSSVTDAVPFNPLKSIVGGIQVLFGQYEKFRDNDEEVQNLKHDLERLYERIHHYAGSLPTEVKDLLTKSLTPAIADIERRIEELKQGSGFTRFIQARPDAKAIIDVSKKISELINDIMMQLDLVAVKQGCELAAKVDEIRRHQILESLRLVKVESASDPESCDRRECYAGTRLKVLTKIEKWINSGDSQPVFCLSGRSGSGKTAIAVSVSQQALKKMENSNGLRFAVFFCSSLSEEASNPNSIFPTLAAQFADWEDVYPVFEDELGLLNMLHSKKKQHKNLLTRVLKAFGESQTKLLIIDGLDECKSEVEALTILSSLLDITNEGIPSLKVLITCRSDSQISATLAAHNACRYSLDSVDSSAHARDLRILLSVELRNLDIAQENINQLVNAVDVANCSFLVALMACRKLNPQDSFDKQLADLKISLLVQENTLYQDFIDDAMPANLPKEGRKPLFAALVIVAFGRNSLGMEALARLLGLTGDQLRSFFRCFPPHILNVVAPGEMVLICHQSFQEYLKSGKDHMNGGDMDGIHFYITQRLLDLMNRSLDREVSSSDFKNLPALSVQTWLYACRYWPEHLQMVAETTSGTEWVKPLFASMHEFFHHKLLNWLEVLMQRDDLDFIESALRDLIEWTKEHCSSAPKGHQSLGDIVSDTLKLYKLSKRALNVPASKRNSELMQSRVYRTFLLPLTHSGQRLARLFRHIKTPIEIEEVSCHRRQIISLNTALENADLKTPIIRLSHDANRFAVIQNGRVEIADSATNVCSVFYPNGSSSQTPVDVMFVGGDHILITTKSSARFAEVWLWSISLKKAEKLLAQPECVSESQSLPRLALSSDSTLVAVLTLSRIEVWAVGEWQQCLTSVRYREGTRDQRTPFALSPHHILAGSRLRTLQSRSAGCRETAGIKFEGTGVCAAFSSNGDMLAVAGNTTVSLFGPLISQGTLSESILPSRVISISSAIDSLMFSPGAQYLAAVALSSLLVWDVSKAAQGDEQPLMWVRSRKEYRVVSSVVFSKCARYLHCAHACPGFRDILLDMRDMEVPASAQTHVTAIAMSSDGRVATGSQNGAVTIWNSTMKKVLQTWQREKHRGPVLSLAFSPNGKYIASVSEDVVYIRSADLTFPLKLSGGSFLPPCAFSNDSAFFVCVIKRDNSSFMRVLKTASWKYHDVRCGDSLEDANSMALSDRADLLALSSNSSLAVYKIAKSVSTLSDREHNIGRLEFLSFSSDNQYVQSTAGVFKIVKLAREPKLHFGRICVRDGWIFDSDDRQVCPIPSEDICQWASSSSSLVFCTKTLGNVVVVSLSRP
ncbi:hypothetical protein GYMLUDRAFT_96790 [Collybiopsis luxurians FD-317 M1]|uniref:NACHT domain-containing protein n=1 Tax=Collybiopsis luxurians FD-317 M1 TaxID=944289 RepID=A0A0D0BBE2_9AGAR|nr:hypothetical protein GYMLUDRAFT_96790 [Collybiopsis luxurians FD-317 M1]